MDADRRTPTRRLPTAVAAILVLALAPAAVRAQSPLGGTLTWQWQQVEEHAKLLQPDGTLRDTTFLRSFWSQYYELRHSAVVAHQLRIGSQVTYLDQSWTDREHARRVAGGTIQLSHPIFGITATYRNGILEIENQRVGPDTGCLCEFVLAVGGHKQQGAQSHAGRLIISPKAVRDTPITRV